MFDFDTNPVNDSCDWFDHVGDVQYAPHDYSPFAWREWVDSLDRDDCMDNRYM